MRTGGKEGAGEVERYWVWDWVWVWGLNFNFFIVSARWRARAQPQGVPGEIVKEFTGSSPREVDEDGEIKEGLLGRETSIGINLRLP